MRYLCLIYEDEKWWEKATEADMQKGMADYNAFTDSIKKIGKEREWTPVVRVRGSSNSAIMTFGAPD